MTKSKYSNRRARGCRGGGKYKPPKKKGASKKKAIDIRGNDNPIALAYGEEASSSASGDNPGFRKARSPKPRPSAGPPPEHVRKDPARHLKRDLLPGAYVDCGDALPGAYVDVHRGV